MVYQDLLFGPEVCDAINEVLKQFMKESPSFIYCYSVELHQKELLLHASLLTKTGIHGF